MLHLVEMVGYIGRSGLVVKGSASDGRGVTPTCGREDASHLQ